MKRESKNNKKSSKSELELNQIRENIFAKAIEEAEKIKKSKKEQDISCGKVVCYINKKKK
jgi:hypothetical protein